MKILVVDDEETKCRLYREELEEEGYVVATALTGKEALEIFRDGSPDLVTLDINMSYGDEGIKLLSMMKALRPGVPVFMLTAYDYRGDNQVSRADAYIVKSADLSELKNRIRSIAAGRGLNKQS